MFELIDNLSLGLSMAVSIDNLLLCLLGVTLGTAIGVIPGIGPTAALSLVLPLTMHLPVAGAMIMMAGIYYGCQYGSSTASILINMPGSASSAVTCLDGYALTKQGRAGAALLVAAFSSLIGAMIGIAILAWSAGWISTFALQFGAAEYFAVMVLGLTAACTVTDTGVLRNLVMVNLGVILGLVGTDVNSGAVRFTGGILELADGFGIALVAMGLFGVAEVITQLAGASTHAADRGTGLWMVKTSEWWSAFKASVRGGVIGSFFGALPGTGPGVSSVVSYNAERQIDHKVGTGSLSGVAAPESANNAAVQTAFVPTLTLGIPGDSIIAVLMGALIMHGVIPGPDFITVHHDLFWTLIASFIIGNMFLIILNVPLIGIWVKLLTVPYQYLYPMIIMGVILGTYSLRNSAEDVLVVAAFGVFGYVLRLMRFQPTPLLLGFVLGPLLEENFRRALIISQGDFGVFIGTLISSLALLAAIVLILYRLVRDVINKKSSAVN